MLAGRVTKRLRLCLNWLEDNMIQAPIDCGWAIEDYHTATYHFFSMQLIVMEV